MQTIYGELKENQIVQTKKSIRGSIFFLLLCVDKKTKDNYKNVNLDEYFENLLLRITSLNEILMCQPELVTVLCLLHSARKEYMKPNFDFMKYRKLILDAGAEIDKLKER